MYEYLINFIGVPYIYGGNNPLVGFDCSGLIVEGLRAQGLIRHDEDLTSQGIYNRMTTGMKYFSPELSGVQRDDLLFFGKSPMEITHIAIARDSRIMLEAGGGDSKCTTIGKAKKRNAFVRERPIRMRSDLVATIRI